MIHPLERLRDDAVRILRAGVEAADPWSPTLAAVRDLDSTFASTPFVSIVSTGKAAARMLHAALEGLSPVSGPVLLAGPGDAPALPGDVERIAGTHPLPDAASVRAGERALAIADVTRSRGGVLLVLLSGGASSYLSAPAEGITIEDKRAVTGALMRAGADIASLNCVRRQLSRIKGGRLAARAGRSVTLAVSDVHLPEDDPATIGSGPTVADGRSPADALEVLRRWGIVPSRAVLEHLERSHVEAPPPLSEAHLFRVVVNRRRAMSGAAGEANRLGYATRVLDRATRGEARDAGAAFALEALDGGSAPARCVIAGGETTVTVRGTGCGGRNQELVLGAAPVIAATGRPAVLASAGTDGIDGPTDAAGGIVDSTTVARAMAAGIDLDGALEANDSHAALNGLGDLVRWGATDTNVGDLHVLVTSLQ